MLIYVNLYVNVKMLIYVNMLRIRSIRLNVFFKKCGLKNTAIFPGKQQR